MRALFVGPWHSRELEIYTDAWDFWNEEPAREVEFRAVGERRDEAILAAAVECSPDVIFYIGGAGGSGLPSVETLRALRDHAKTVNLCCDSADSPWRPFLLEYAARGCFDLQVGLDGPLDAPVDLATLPPINPAAYDVEPVPDRDIRCGFVGQFMPGTPRGRIVSELIKRGALKFTQREISAAFDDANPYSHYVALMRRFRIAFNHGLNTIDGRPTVKWRVLEIALAGAALLENENDLFWRWFPRGSAFHYVSAADAVQIIATASASEIAERAGRLSEKVRRDYRPERIYGEILDRIGLSR